MSKPENVFKGDRALIAKTDIEAPLIKAEAPCCEYYIGTFVLAAQEAEISGNLETAKIYRFLQAITSFHLSVDTPAEPFGPHAQMGARRTLIPSDLTPDDVETIREILKVAKNPALSARLHDVIWEVTNDYRQCGEAAVNYIEAAEKLNIPDQWIYSVEYYHRGLYLAAKLGRKKDLFKKASESLLQAARNTAIDTEELRCCQFLRLLVRFGCGDPVELAKIAAGHALKATQNGDARITRFYRDVETDLHRLAKDTNAESISRLAAAETYIIESEERVKGAGASPLAAASILQKGIEALRRAGERSERIVELRKRLTELQGASLKEMQSFETEIDITKAIQEAETHVKGLGFEDAVFRFALGHPLSNPAEIRKAVLRQAKDYPLANLFGASIIDEKGRTTTLKAPLLDLREGENEGQIEAEMFSYAARFNWLVRANGYIEPARRQILNDHRPGFQDLLFIVRNNPFIPPGHEGIFLRGLHAGFHGDFLIATHLLTPQIENSLRYVLESYDVDVSNLMSDGTQPVKVLGAIFDIPESKQIFGDQLCFELRGCLIEKTGYDFRNRIAHGFAHESECCSHVGITVWWLALHICVTPVYGALIAQKKSDENKGNTTTPTNE